jgi:hypothetical protein
VPRNTHHRRNTAKLLPFHRSPDTHDGEMRLAKHACDCVCTALSKYLRNYSCPVRGRCYVGGSRTREKLGMPMRAYSFLLLPRQNHHPATFPSPAAEKVQRSAPPHHHISQTSAKHQPNIIWQNHLRLSSFRLSVVLALFPANAFFLPSFLSSILMFHSPTRAEVMTPTSNQSRVTVFTCFCTISAWMWWKSSGATKDVVALQILSDHLKNLEVGLGA